MVNPIPTPGTPGLPGGRSPRTGSNHVVTQIKFKVQKLRQESGTWETALRKLEQDLHTVGDDSQLSQVDLQNFCQRMEQTLGALSNLCKSIHTTAMATIRKKSK